MTYTTTTSFYKGIEQYLDFTTHILLYTGSTVWLRGNRAETIYSIVVKERATGQEVNLNLCLDASKKMDVGGSWWTLRQALDTDKDVVFYKKLKTLARVCAE